MKKRKLKWPGFVLALAICTLSVLVPSWLLMKGLESVAEVKSETETLSDTQDSDSSGRQPESLEEQSSLSLTQSDGQESIKARIEEIRTGRESFLAEMNAIPKPAEMPDQEFADLKARAMESDLDALLEQYEQEESFDPDLADQILALSEYENDYSALLREINQIPYDYIWRLEEDWDRYHFTMEYIHKDQYQTPPERTGADLSSVPLYIQWDLDWAYLPYGDLDIALAGCAPTCISMIFSYLLQDDALTPARIASEAQAAGMYIIGAGSSHDIFPVMSQQYGITCTPLSVDQASIDQALQAGEPVVLNMVPGIFTHVGHFIVVTGIKDGKWVINDPNSYTRSNQLWDPSVVLAECRKAWSFSR